MESKKFEGAISSSVGFWYTMYADQELILAFFAWIDENFVDPTTVFEGNIIGVVEMGVVGDTESLDAAVFTDAGKHYCVIFRPTLPAVFTIDGVDYSFS